MITDPTMSRKFGKLVLEAVGADEQHVLDGSLKVEIDSSSHTARVTWECAAWISREDLARIVEEAQT